LNLKQSSAISSMCTVQQKAAGITAELWTYLLVRTWTAWLFFVWLSYLV